MNGKEAVLHRARQLLPLSLEYVISSSNIINDTLKSIFLVKHLNTRSIYARSDASWIEGEREEKGWKRLFPTLAPRLQHFDSFNCEQSLRGECETQYEKNNINLAFHQICFGYIEIGFLYLPFASLSADISVRIASGAVQTWNRVCENLVLPAAKLFSLLFFIESISV